MPAIVNLTSCRLGLALALSAWLVLRLGTGTRGRWSPTALLLDACLPAICFALIAAATAKPVFAGVITLVLAGGYCYADRAKLKVLGEPVVFTDVFQAFDIFRHPQLALPFPHKGRVAGGVLAVVSVFALLYELESPAWAWSLAPLLGACAALALGIRALGGHYSPRVAAGLRRLGFSGEPRRDAAQFGPLAVLLAYGIIARGERLQRQSAVPPTALPEVARSRTLGGRPLVVVQCESFFDARRLDARLGAGLLPAFDRCRANASQWGRLDVPCWGANTVRTEFAVLTGLADQAIGFDYFNPYHRFARAPVKSLAWQLRAEGYRTICIHPFDRSFYGRDLVMPNLGFDLFLGEEAFGPDAERSNGYISDAETARLANQVLAKQGPNTFLFIITMENHGPWSRPGEAPVRAPDLNLPEAERTAFGRYLQSLNGADRMVGLLTDTLGLGGADGLLAFYGDHLPAFPSVFRRFGLEDRRSDYFVWSSAGGSGERTDIAAHDLQKAILDARLGVRRVQPAWGRRVVPIKR